MKRRIWLLALTSGLLTVGPSVAELAWTTDVPKAWRHTLAKAHNRDYVGDYDKNIDFSRAPFRVAQVDISGKSSLLLIWDDSMYCGSAGCRIELWIPDGADGYKEVLGIHGAEVTVGDTEHLGMSDLWIDDMRHRWNGERYTGGYENNALTVASTPPASAPAKRPIIPVMVGGEPDLDACGGSGVVKGLKKGGDGFLSLRAGPDRAFGELARLRNGDAVIMCDYKAPWHGVIIPHGEKCSELSSPIARKTPYEGACQAGWVHESFIEQIAG